MCICSCNETVQIELKFSLAYITEKMPTFPPVAAYFFKDRHVKFSSTLLVSLVTAGTRWHQGASQGCSAKG